MFDNRDFYRQSARARADDEDAYLRGLREGIDIGLVRGIEKGLEKGREKGSEGHARMVAAKLKDKGYGQTFIEEITGGL